MKEQELLFLGLLNDGPKHGYQLKKLMQGISSTFTGLKNVSIYYPLKKMLKAGLVSQAQAKEGRRPKKYVYKITPQGQNEFRKMLLRSLLTIERPYFSIDLALYFLNYIPADLRKRYLHTRLKLLVRLKKGLEEFKTASASKFLPHLVNILEHNQELLEAEIKFITRLTGDTLS